MNDYDFRALNDKEFEVMSCDLLSHSEGKRYERFKPGRDGGVDGRFFSEDGGEVILQCKHWPSSTLNKLISHLKNTELPKLQILNPRRYILILSHPLSRSDKSYIRELLSPYIKCDNDVFGREDLNDLIYQFPEIERRHYKLWISSSNVLINLLNKPIYDRSSFVIDEIKQTAHLYVQTNNHNKALEVLELLGTAIVTGSAGVGKTTLAEHLALHYIEQGYQFYSISEEINEAEGIYERNQKQLFYFDDFLGRNYLEALSGHEGSHIVQFIKRVGRDNKKRFILTSRSTILNQGKLLNDVFIDNNIDRNEFEISLSSFSDIDKAQILYNHLWHSNLDITYIDELYKDKRYRRVIDHRNFNPRLIKYITDMDRVDSVSTNGYWEYVSDMLSNPERIWENPFEAQHDDFGRAIVLLVALNGKEIEQDILARSFKEFVSLPENVSMNGRRDFLSNIKHLSGSLLSRRIMTSATLSVKLNLFNPSIGDYVLHRYINDLPTLRSGFNSLSSIGSLRTLSNLVKNNLLDSIVASSIALEILNARSKNKYLYCDAEYIAFLCLMLRDLEAEFDPEKVLLVDAISFVLSEPCPAMLEYVAELVRWALDKGLIKIDAAARFFGDAIDKYPSEEELEKLGEIHIRLIESSVNSYTDAFEDVICDFFTGDIYDALPDEEVFEYVDLGDYDEIKLNLKNIVSDKVDRFGIFASEKFKSDIIDCYDLYERHDTFFSKNEVDRKINNASFITPFDEIDDLFDRS